MVFLRKKSDGLEQIDQTIVMWILFDTSGFRYATYRIRTRSRMLHPPADHGIIYLQKQGPFSQGSSQIIKSFLDPSPIYRVRSFLLNTREKNEEKQKTGCRRFSMNHRSEDNVSGSMCRARHPPEARSPGPRSRRSGNNSDPGSLDTTHRISYLTLGECSIREIFGVLNLPQKLAIVPQAPHWALYGDRVSLPWSWRSRHETR